MERDADAVLYNYPRVVKRDSQIMHSSENGTIMSLESHGHSSQSSSAASGTAQDEFLSSPPLSESVSSFALSPSNSFDSPERLDPHPLKDPGVEKERVAFPSSSKRNGRNQLESPPPWTRTMSTPNVLSSSSSNAPSSYTVRASSSIGAKSWKTTGIYTKTTSTTKRTVHLSNPPSPALSRTNLPLPSTNGKPKRKSTNSASSYLSTSSSSEEEREVTRKNTTANSRTFAHTYPRRYTKSEFLRPSGLRTAIPSGYNSRNLRNHIRTNSGAHARGGVADLGGRFWRPSKSGSSTPIHAGGGGATSDRMKDYVLRGNAGTMEEWDGTQMRSSEDDMDDDSLFGRPAYGSAFPRSNGRFKSTPTPFLFANGNGMRERTRTNSGPTSDSRSRASSLFTMENMSPSSPSYPYGHPRRRAPSPQNTSDASSLSSTISKYGPVSLAVARSSLLSMTSVVCLFILSLLTALAIVGVVLGSYGLTVWDDFKRVFGGGKAKTETSLLAGGVGEKIRFIGKAVEGIWEKGKAWLGVEGFGRRTFSFIPASSSSTSRRSTGETKITDDQYDSRRANNSRSRTPEEEYQEEKSSPPRPPMLILVPSIILALVIMLWKLGDSLIATARSGDTKKKKKRTSGH
ncbi:hypothetical protein BT69DRAFT_1352070 [Atractiella rhizophila]|nr:hypothetical protein BT69DRAFT_1352070 [Atractiella rhizophila]